MIAIGVLNTKGGVAKTTLTACLAVRASHDGSTCVVDLDPQGSLGDWHRLRGSPDNPALLVGADRASEALEGLRLSSAYAWVLLDGPPGALRITEDAIRSVDFVVVPMRASGLDIAATQDAISVCNEIGTPYVIVINDAGARDTKLVENARGLLLNWRLPIADTVVSHRVQYVNAMTTGRTGPEKDKAAAAEIDALWAEIRKAALKAVKQRRAA